jgi:hypothetical protein
MWPGEFQVAWGKRSSGVQEFEEFRISVLPFAEFQRRAPDRDELTHSVDFLIPWFILNF